MPINYITIQLNGEPFNCLHSMSLKDILDYLDVNLSSVIIEHNCQIVNYHYYSQTFLRNGDKLEILTIVGGG